MHEIKRIQSILSFNRNTGISTGLNDLHSVRRRSPFLRAIDRRVSKIPAEYKAKARAADAQPVGDGGGPTLNALNAMSEVKSKLRQGSLPWPLHPSRSELGLRQLLVLGKVLSQGLNVTMAPTSARIRALDIPGEG